MAPKTTTSSASPKAKAGCPSNADRRFSPPFGASGRSAVGIPQEEPLAATAQVTPGCWLGPSRMPCPVRCPGMGRHAGQAEAMDSDLLVGWLPTVTGLTGRILDRDLDRGHGPDASDRDVPARGRRHHRPVTDPSLVTGQQPASLPNVSPGSPVPTQPREILDRLEILPPPRWPRSCANGRAARDRPARGPSLPYP